MTDTAPIRLITLDDHELLRRGIRFSLLPVADIELVGEAADGEEAVQICRELGPDVMLVDMRLPGPMDGVATIRAIRAECPDVRMLALSSFHDRNLVQAAMQAGAVGYLVKGVSGEELAQAIRAAFRGQLTLAPEAVDALIQTGHTAPTLGRDLTERELDVLAPLTAGKSNAEIAEDLSVSVAAVKFHVSNILSKLGAANRTEAAALARAHGLVPDPPQ